MKFKKVVLAFIVAVVLLAGGIYFLGQHPNGIKPSYTQTYRLVPEKISQSAAIRVNLPPQTDREFAQKNIKFYPEIKGGWLTQEKPLSFFLNFVLAAESLPSENSEFLLFKPEEKLKLNRYYSAELTVSDGGLIKADFLAVEDPEISAIFPKKDFEAPENSEITIVFNRPMVPLTTLGYLEEKEVPVEIAPLTEGRFKWISTNNLQFIPKERLVLSSRYKVKVKSGLASMDGLKLKEMESEFVTRMLRYFDLTSGQIIYNQPISIYFNQPVDLEKTKQEIALINNITGKETSFIAEFRKTAKEEAGGRARSFSGGLGKFLPLNVPGSDEFLAEIAAVVGFDIIPPLTKKENVNQSIIEIYNKKDRFGRKKLWDFGSSYTLRINKAYPAEGDIILDESRAAVVSVSGVISNTWAESSRSRWSAPNFFDPQGKLWVKFYEEIDLSESKITAPKLKEIGYGEKCRKEKDLFQNVECEKVQDKTKIFFVFQSEKIGLGERLNLNFEKIVNSEGLTVNRETIQREIISYPEFKILSAHPGNNSTGADLTELVICSNSPISVPAREDWKKYFSSNLDYELKSWNDSWKLDSRWTGEKCQNREFHTSIYYGLMPKSDYSLALNLEDHFGQKQTLALNFTTGEMPGTYLNFYHLQNDYNVTSPEKTKLTYAAENMEYVILDICKLEPLDFFYYLENKLNYDQSSNVIANCKETIRDGVELPKRYWLKNYFKLDLKDYFADDLLGHYIITFSHPEHKTSYWDWQIKTNVEKQVYERTYLTITNLAVGEKRIQPMAPGREGQLESPLNADEFNKLSNLYWVSSISNLEPVAGANVVLYRANQGGKLVSAGLYKTDSQGIALTDLVYDLEGAIISSGKDSAIIPTGESRLNWTDMAFSAKRIYLYTDKPIYRPGQEVFLKGFYRIGYDGNYEIYREKELNLKISNSKGDEILNKNLGVNDFGAFNTQLVLDGDVPLGTYQVCAEEYSCIPFEVLEYVPAPFEVKLKTEQEEYISKDTVNLDIEARYYFGVPLEGGEITYAISSQNYYFDRYLGGYFDSDSRWYWEPPYNYGDKFILRGRTSLDPRGKARISQTLDLEKLLKGETERKSKIIVFDVTVQSPQGQTVSAQQSFILHNGEFYLGLDSDKNFLAKDEKIDLRIKSVDTQGKEISVEGIAFNLYKTDWIYSKRQEACGGWSYKWEKKRDLIQSSNFYTDKKGNAVRSVQISLEGEYEAEVIAKDKRNNLVSDSYNFYVYGRGEVIVRPTKDTELEIETEKTDLNVGDKGRIIIKSPYSRAKALISVERGKIFDYQIKEIEGNLYSFDFEIREDYIPNIYVSVLLLSAEPEIKFGKVEFKINTEREKLDIEVKSNKKQYLPGEEVVLDILAKDYKGAPASAELSVAVVDLSVLALKGNPKKNPLIFFYDGFPLTVSTASNIKDILVEIEIPKGKGGGGMAAEALAVKKRGIFRETAFWLAEVKTDAGGRAQVKFTLPDNLTTWQAETLGLTRDTKLGANYVEFTTRKELMVVPLKPRFVVPGDSFFIGAQIFNQSKQKQTLTLTFSSPNLALKEDVSEKNVELGVDETKTIYFYVESPGQYKGKEHNFVLSAKGEGIEDIVENRINVTQNNTYETTATSNFTTEQIWKEYVFLPDNIISDRGDLTIKSSATLAVFLSDALNYLLQFPYGCSEQIASKLDSIAIVKRGLDLPNISEKFNLEKIKDGQGKEYAIEEVVEISLSKLYSNQQWDGGFAFWPGGKTDFYLTLHIVDALNNVSLAGFDVNQNSLDRAANYLAAEIVKGRRNYESEDDYKNRLIIASYTLSNLSVWSGQKDVLGGKLIEITKDDLFLQDKISNASLAYLAIALTKGFDKNLSTKIFNLLDNRIDIDSRGAFLETGKNIIWRYYETPIKNTALYLKAQTTTRSQNPIIDKVLRWLLASRQKDGVWGSTNNTISVIDGFVDYLQRKRETESNFSLEVLINDKSEGRFDFEPATILEQFKKEISVPELKFNENNIIQFSKTDRNNLANGYYYDMSLKYYLPADQIPPRDEGFSITREFFRVDDKQNENPLREAKVGEVLRAHLKITAPKTRNYVMVEDYIPAGMEIVNLDLATEQKSLLLEEEYKRDPGYWREHFDRTFYPDFKELRDDRAFLYVENLGPGVYEFDYYIRALVKGKFNHLPAIVSEMYFPENFGRTDGRYFEIK